MADSEKTVFDELSFYTLAHPDQVYFIHQHIVDAWHAQHADDHTSPIGIVFPLMGLYLFLERGFTGRQVQLMHMKMAPQKGSFVKQPFPDFRGAVTVVEVLKAEPGESRDAMIRQWCASVWEAYQSWHTYIRQVTPA